MKQVRETNAGKSISAWVVLRANGEYCATVQAYYGQSRTQVDVWQHGKDLQQGAASGYGYDKFTAALTGIQIDGILMTDHCSTDSRTSAILEAYTRKITHAQNQGAPKKVIDGIEKYYAGKAEKIGASFANYNEFIKVPDEAEIMRYNYKGDDEKTIEKARENGWARWRYTSLYLSAGLKKLEALGYRVIQAI